MGRVVELVVTKGKTIKIEGRDEWFKAEYSIKAQIDCDEETAIAKAQLEGLIDGWLTSALRPNFKLSSRRELSEE